jgi:hypothetical protein
MSYCHECGAKIEDENVFCTKCGTKQIENSKVEEIESHKNQDFIQENNFFNSQGESQKELYDSYRNLKNQVNFSSLGDILIKMLLKPVSGGKQFIENSEKSSVIGLTVFLTVMQGILGVWKVNQVISAVQNIAIDLIQKMSGIMNLIQPGASGKLLDSSEIMDMTTQINKVKSFINIPYGKIFLQNSALFLMAIIILFIIIYLGTNILSKHRSEPFTIYKIALIISVPTLYFEIFSIIFSYMSFSIGAAIVLIGVIVSLGCLTIIIKEELPIEQNHAVFITAISFIVFFAAVSMCLQKFFTSNVTDIIMSVTNIMKTVKY